MTTSFPTGTVTFLFTDIEGSTQLWEKYPEKMHSTLAQHDAILRDVITTNYGHIIKTTGDGVHAVFEKAIDAANTTLEAQLTLQTSEFLKNSEVSLQVRMGLHTGEAELRGNDYYGQSLNRAARIMAAAHGGQILLSNITAELIREHLPANTNLLDLGEHHLKDLTRPERLYQLNAAGLRQDFPAIQSVNIFQTNLPAQLTSFIGREKELTEIKALLDSARLVTLTGSGGTGKSRLSIEIGKGELPSFPNGVWLVELAPLTDASQILPTMAQIFGLQEHLLGPLANVLLDYLRDKKLLLILDNCEHLIEACAKLATELLQQCAGLKILASSREALGIAGEVAYHTPSLGNSDSVKLFCERALALNPNFHLTENSASHVTQICSRLDGIPLAIELTAARTKLFSVEQIAARLDNMLRLLVGGSRTALPRQQTLRALIDWSYDLLSEEEKRILQFASVFVGGWTLDALEFVSNDPKALELLEQLINKSLVVTEEREGEMRYFMLETIRQYAREKLFEAKQSSAARDRHFVYFDQFSEEIWNTFRSDDLLPLVKRSNDELENIRAASEWGLANNIEANIRLAANFCVITSGLGLIAEGVAMAKNAVERAKDLPPVEGEANLQRQKMIARALFAQGMTGIGTGNLHRVIEVLKEAIAIARLVDDKLILGYSLQNYFSATGFMGGTSDREAAARESIYIFTHEINDNFGLGMAYMMMARLAAENGNEAERQLYLGKMKEPIRETPGSFQVGLFYLGMGLDESLRGNHAAAKKFFEDGLVIFKNTSGLNFQLVLKSEIGHVERRTGNLRQAKSIYQETLRGWQQLGNRGAISHQLECFSFLALADEEPQRAIQLLGAAEALREHIDSPMAEHEQNEYRQAMTRLQTMVAEPEFNSLWAEGRSLTMERAIQLALNE